MEMKMMMDILENSGYFKKMESLIDHIISKRLNDHMVIFTNKPLFGAKEIKKELLTDTKGICQIMGVSRQTLSKWEKGGHSKRLLSPFILKMKGRKTYDPYGITLTAFENPEVFGSNFISRVKESNSNFEIVDLNLKFDQLSNRVDNHKIISPDEYIFYAIECKARGMRVSKGGY